MAQDLPTEDSLALKLSYALQVVPPPAKAAPPAVQVAPPSPAARPFGLPDASLVAIPVAVALTAGLLLAARANRVRRAGALPAEGIATERRVAEAPEPGPGNDTLPAAQTTAPEAVPAAPQVAPTVRPAQVASLQDLHDLQERLELAGNRISRQRLLEDHLEQHAHTSPWVLLELREVRGSRHYLWADEERTEFARRFAVRPPSDRDWARRHDAILEDPQLGAHLQSGWPLETKSVITRWMLGSYDGRPPRHGMPVLTLGTYRELLFLDGLLGAREFDHPSEFAPLH